VHEVGCWALNNGVDGLRRCSGRFQVRHGGCGFGDDSYVGYRRLRYVKNCVGGFYLSETMRRFPIVFGCGLLMLCLEQGWGRYGRPRSNDNGLEGRYSRLQVRHGRWGWCGDSYGTSRRLEYGKFLQCLRTLLSEIMRKWYHTMSAGWLVVTESIMMEMSAPKQPT